MQHVVKALVIEDEDLMRKALIQEITAALGVCAVHGAATLEQALNLIQTENFQYIFIDPGLFEYGKGIGRIPTIVAILLASPSAKHIVVTSESSIEEANRCQQLGVHSYLSKVGLDKKTIEAELGNTSREVVRFV